MQTTVRDKRTNMNNELRTLESCLVDIQNGGDASACGGQSAAVLNQQINNLSAYAQVNNQCMSFLFGNKVNGSFQTDIVNTDLTTFITFQENSQQVIRQVRQNLRILEQYRLFPFELYEWVHVWDRYLSELSAVLDSFLGSVMQWIQQNARRFEKWVDAVITMIGVIKTWQAIIDLSVNRSSTCSKCTNENYDNYSCKLSFICVDLPIIPIPQFKIPSIFLDFSHIDLGIDVLLPEFNFVPTRVPLPQLPNLPSPPQVNIDIDLDLKL